jgi:hypothetical protein
MSSSSPLEESQFLVFRAAACEFGQKGLSLAAWVAKWPSQLLLLDKIPCLERSTTRKIKWSSQSKQQTAVPEQNAALPSALRPHVSVLRAFVSAFRVFGVQHEHCYSMTQVI